MIDGTDPTSLSPARRLAFWKDGINGPPGAHAYSPANNICKNPEWTALAWPGLTAQVPLRSRTYTTSNVFSAASSSFVLSAQVLLLFMVVLISNTWKHKQENNAKTYVLQTILFVIAFDMSQTLGRLHWSWAWLSTSHLDNALECCPL